MLPASCGSCLEVQNTHEGNRDIWCIFCQSLGILFWLWFNLSYIFLRLMFWKCFSTLHLISILVGITLHMAIFFVAWKHSWAAFWSDVLKGRIYLQLPLPAPYGVTQHQWLACLNRTCLSRMWSKKRISIFDSINHVCEIVCLPSHFTGIFLWPHKHFFYLWKATT